METTASVSIAFGSVTLAALLCLLGAATWSLARARRSRDEERARSLVELAWCLVPLSMLAVLLMLVSPHLHG